MRLTTTALVAAGIVSLLVVSLVGVRDANAFARYQDGCNAAECHSNFTDDVSTKGSTFVNGSKHEMHRNASEMNTECNLCHTTGDQRNPLTGSSNGTATNPGLGCTGCHNGNGLRRHHVNSNPAVLGFCTNTPGCHVDAAAPPENTSPPYYGTIDTLADDPCNPTAQVGVNENWTSNGFEGLDNDGDLLYDGVDPDCATVASSPGDVPMLLVTAHDPTTSSLSLSWGDACDSTDHTVEFGPLGDLRVGTYNYSGQSCGLGDGGSGMWSYPGGDLFFLLVANNGTDEGSYGTRREIGGTFTERPEDTTNTICAFPQNLTDRCDP